MLSLIKLTVFSLLHITFALATTTASSTTSATSTSTKPIDDLTPILSDFWTEGLIICLFVSLLLIFIVVIAIKATSSIGISYGALEDKTQNQDSNKKFN
ncbi:hypothetical protein HANVADRAFT_112414 [Hanseniaspora valbyensis NRRL Y-1626]|uniref:V-type proton ATPase subunit S1/VOA1 transmembrane domain-containing protein n=1 Tax=Hanseniaspora valbyensis NRRL Y-1626 TaxID=766949 RepID=A0A1B7TFS4_9ASCO|nr:hypothetical protein HANVADRAFT_112414 [Hanseniaspora valbyensis NRRL Y-1626]